jgi:two-component system chemotaxis response regulator CheY
MSNKLTVLVADDAALARDTLKYILLNMDINKTYDASNGRDAIDLFRKHKPGITFLDISMPEINGMECLKHIKSTDPESFIVLVSGHSDAQTVKNAIKNGANGYVVKPYSAEKIKAMIEKYESE